MRKLKGSTLQELLVAMIIIGILFLSVMEGYILLKRFCRQTSVHMEKNLDSLVFYYKQNQYVMAADTIIIKDTLTQ